MSYRHAFDLAIGQAPRCTIDIDAVISGQRRAARRTRVAAVVVAVVALAGGAGVVANRPVTPPAAGAAVGASFLTPAPATVAATPTITASVVWVPPRTREVRTAQPMPTFAGVAPTEDVGAADARLTAAMRAAVLAAAPTAALDGAFSVGFWTSQARPVHGGGWTAPEFAYRGRQTVHNGGRVCEVSISVHRMTYPDRCAPGLEAQVSCVESTGPDGEHIVTLVRGDVDRFMWVRVARADGSEVLAAISYQREEPLTVAQLRAIALNPILTLYP